MAESSSSSTTCTAATCSDKVNWPLHKIVEPHECNDVLLSGPQKQRKTTTPASSSSSDDKGGVAVEEEHIPWRSSSIFRHESKSDEDDDYNGGDDDGHQHPKSNNATVNQLYKGNQRFWELLVAHRLDFEGKSRMEQPLVTVRVLQQWRNQAPPGRFLVAETNTSPPLWKDIGDKKARARISKALKHLTKTAGSQKAEAQEQNKSSDDSQHAPSCQGQTMFQQKVASVEKLAAIQDPPKTATKENDSNALADWPSSSTNNTAAAATATAVNMTPPPVATTIVRNRPKIPRFQKLDKNVRRISEQLNSAQQDGKMYGRWTERDRLVQIYKHQRQQHELHLLQQQQQQQPERQSITTSPPTVASTTVASSPLVVDFVLISGTMGVGKTSLAHTLKNPLVDEVELDNDDFISTCTTSMTGPEPPFFLQGKFQHCKWEDPNTVFVAVIADFCHQLEKRNDPMLTKRYRDAIQMSLKDDITLLTNLVPALAATLKRTITDVEGSVTSCCEESKTHRDDSYACMAMQRVKRVLGVFLETIAAASPQHAVIVLLDDLNYASEPALDILTSLVANKSHCGILFMGTYRTDEYKDGHFTKAIQQLRSCHTVQVNKIELCNLEEGSVHFMLAETLSLQEEETQSLKDLVFSLTKGNPTFINELLRNFQDEGILHYDEASMQWTCDIQQIPLTLGDIHSVPDLFKAKILALPPTIQETLKIAACLMSTQVDEALLKMIDTVGAVSPHLKFADTSGLLQYRDGLYYFVSTGVKEAAYNLISEAERPSYHVRIGQRLWPHLQEKQNSEFYTVLMTQIIMGDQIITQDEDRRSVALLYLESGQKAAKYLGFQTAWYCLSRGIAMMSSQKKWGRDNYDLSLSLYNTAIEVCYCNGEFAELENLIAEVLENARTFEDTLLARSSLIYSLGSRNKQLEAIEMGLETLKELGESFPCMNPSSFCVFYRSRKVKKLLRGLSDQDVLQLPRMKDPKKLAAMQILNHVVLYTVYTIPRLSALVAFRMVELTMKHGLSAISSAGFVVYGMILCRYDAIDEGYFYGELAMKICDMFKKEVWMCRTWAGFYGTIYARKHAVKGSLEPLQTAYRVGMLSGDIEYSLLNACLELWNGFAMMTLPAMDSKMREVSADAESYGQTLNMVMLKPLWQSTLNFMGQASGDPKIIQGELIDDDIEAAKGGGNPHFTMWVRFSSMQVAYIFGDYDLAETFIDAAKEIHTNNSGAMDGGLAILYECMVLLAQARRGKRRYRILACVRRRLKRLKLWAMHSPHNFLAKQYLIQAEVAAVCRDRQKAIAHYRTAILHSREAGFLLEEALANERLARSYLEWKDTKSAIPFLEEARRVYERWGGVGKVNHFQEEFGDFLKESHSFRHSITWLGRSITT